MRMQSVVPWMAVVGTLTSWSPDAAVGQELTLGPRTLRFLYASSTAAKPVEIDVHHNAVLARVISLHVERTTIGGLLVEVQRQTGLTFAYDPHFPATRPVTLEADSVTVAAALGAILVGTGVDVVLSPTGHVWLMETVHSVPRAQEGSIAGQVTDESTNDPLVGATAVLDPSQKTTTTDGHGRYHFTAVAAGSYTVRVRYIGYTSVATSVAVSTDQEATVDFPLEKSPQPLEQVVVTGTVVPTAVKALPTPVTVITESDIAQQRPRNVQELFRRAVPGAVSWDLAKSYYLTSFSTRGASTLAGPTAQMKVFVDGIETALASVSGVDPNSIARMEVIRGPQAAALYGSDAISGVIEIFTKRGDPKLSRPEVNVEAALGLVQTPYAGYGGVLRQQYRAAVRGGGPDVRYNFGAGYSHLGDWIPNGEVSKQSNPSVYGGMSLTHGVIAIDLSGRYYVQNYGGAVNPQLSQTGFVTYSKPFYSPQQIQNQTVGARLSATLIPGWVHTVRVGLDRYTLGYAQTQPRLTSPSDTLLQVLNQSQMKTSIAYNTSLQMRLASGMSGSLTAGLDHWNLPVSTWYALGALNTTGAIRPAPGQAVSASRTITNNTGYFGQVQLGFHDVLFLTGGLRAEQNTNFGDSLSAPLSPRAGLSYLQRVGTGTLKLRGSWGRAIRAPFPGLELGGVSATSVTLPNAALGPERQQGWDAGIEAVFSDRGTLSITYYDQTADNLIQSVQLQTAPIRTFQNQNVGRVRNTGVEIEGTLFVGLLQLKAQYGYARSRVDHLAPGYTGDLQIDDQTLGTPKHTAGASFSLNAFRGTVVSGGLTYVGSWANYDILAEISCFAQTGPCQPTRRGYIATYPSFVKLNAGVSQALTPIVSGFVSVDNITNNDTYEMNKVDPVMGRTTTVGLQLHY